MMGYFHFFFVAFFALAFVAVLFVLVTPLPMIDNEPYPFPIALLISDCFF